MQVQTLDELKAENAEVETEVTEQPASEVAEDETQAAEEGQEEPEQAAEPAADEPEPETVESWMQAESEGSEGEQTFTNRDMRGLRKKLEGKLEEKDSELEQLKQRLQQLEGGSTPNQQQPVAAKPTLEQFDYDSDKYEAAMVEYLDNQVDSKIKAATQATQVTAAQQAAQAQMKKDLDAHYERAASLTKEAGIDPEVYQASDLAVRTVVSSVPQFSKVADQVVDGLITKLGEGSEKLMYYVGRNPTVQMKLRDHLTNDPSGISLGVYLGELKAKLAEPVKKVSRAAKPAKAAKGDQAVSGGTWKRKYDRAKTAQEKFNIRREAKKAGENVRGW